MKVRYLLATAVVWSISTATLADEKTDALFKDGLCINCHTVERKTVGPTLRSIADKYKDDKDAQAKLEKKVREGGAGSWGVMPMPSTPQTISDEGITMLVTWVLQQKTPPKVEPKAETKPARKSDAKTNKKPEPEKK